MNLLASDNHGYRNQSRTMPREKLTFRKASRIAESGSDGPVLMLNMNRYSLESGFPDRGVYQQYISGLGNSLEGAGAKLLWRFPVLGQAVGVNRCSKCLISTRALDHVDTAFG